MGNVIEINGKKYDAVTGKLLSGQNIKRTAANKTSSDPAAVDGMVGAKKSASYRAPVHAKKSVQKSRTLMRGAVKKPSAAHKPAQQASVSGITRSQLGSSQQRQRIAAKTSQSSHISHFGRSQTEPVPITKKIQHMPVKHHRTAAKTHAATHHASKPPASKRSSHAVAKVGRAASAKTVKKKNIAAATMIENALQNATSHHQQPHRATKRHHRITRRLGVSARATAISAVVLAGVLLGGFYAIQNVPNLSMRVAATRAGFDAQFPGYSPSGFSFRGPISYSAGQVTISFRSNVDNRAYQLTQRASNWNSQALLSNYVKPDHQSYQTYKDRGRTLYIYDQSNATWVDNGIWYQIEGESQMTTDQLIRVAASL